MKKLITVALVTILALNMFTGCGKPKTSDSKPNNDASSTSAQEPAKDAIVLKLNHVSNEQGVYQKAALKFKEEVEARTNGAVQVQIYSSAQLGNERDMVESMQYGTIDIGFVATAVLGSFVPEYALLDAPFVFQDEAHAAKVTNGKVGAFLSDKLLEKQGIRTIGYYQNGFRHIFSTKKVEKMADFKGLKIRVMENPLHQAAFTKLGALPVPMAFGEVFTALQQKTIDAAENSLDNIYSQKFNEVTKNVTLSGHAFGFVVLCLSEKSWEKIPEEYHDAVLEAGKISTEYEMQIMQEANEAAKEKLEAAGVTVVEIDRNELAKACESIQSEFAEQLPKEYMDEIQNSKG